MPKVNEDVKVSLYNITKCGYYPFGRSKRPPFFGIGDSLKGIYDWVHQDGMTLSQTQTFKVSDDSEDLLTLCYDIQKNNSDEYLLITWNAVPSTNNAIAAIRVTEPVGSASVITSQFGSDDIPGYATYFWFLPKENIFATIRFQHTINGQNNMRKFILGYLQNFTKHVYRSTSENGNEKISYKLNDEDSVTARPVFNTSRMKLPGEIDEIRENIFRVNKIIQTTKLEPILKTADSNFYKWALKILGLATPDIQQQEVEIKNEMKIRISEGEFDEIVKNWKETNYSAGTFDVGFTYQGDAQNIHWLSNSLAKAQASLSFERQSGNNEIVDAKSLLSALTASKSLILKEARYEVAAS